MGMGTWAPQLSKRGEGRLKSMVEEVVVAVGGSGWLSLVVNRESTPIRVFLESIETLASLSHPLHTHSNRIVNNQQARQAAAAAGGGCALLELFRTLQQQVFRLAASSLLLLVLQAGAAGGGQRRPKLAG
jgi:hypothetical protein